MFKRFASIRLRLTLWYSGVLLTTLIVFALGDYTYLSQTMESNLDRSLSNEVRWVKTFIESKATKVKPSKKFLIKKKTAKEQPAVVVAPPPATTDEPDETTEAPDADEELWNHVYEHALLNTQKTVIEVIDKKTGNSLYSVGAESVMVADDAPINVLTAATIKNKKGATFRVASTSTESLKILAAYPLDDLKGVLDDLFSEFLILIPIALVVSIGGGYFLANISLRPVDAVTKTAQEITAHNLDRRLHESGVNDEIGRLSSTFNDMIARLNGSFQQVKQFTIDASHELRTPLTIMRGEVELALRSPKSSEQYKAVLVSALEEIVRLTSIIDGLMLLSKADLGMQEVAFAPVELNRMVEELYEDAEILASKKHIEVSLERNDQIELQGDKVRLSQLLLNLVDNAVKYTPDNGQIFISLERQNGSARIRVRDTGMGIPENEQTRIFNRFYRVDKARTRDLGGIGLGLSIVKWVADLHRGTIELHSEEGKGSEFTVILPINGASHG